MLRSFIAGACLLTATAAIAQEDHCTALYQQLRAEAPGDVSKCKPVIKEARRDQCTLPSGDGSTRLPSHVVMVLDASGSMAGKVGGKQKMVVAKSEARKFLSDVAKDVPVGLIVYGHRGTNKESGKAESCAAVEWALPVGASRSKVRAAVDALSPTGWTPMGDSLLFAKSELEKMEIKKDDKTSTPVVYLISDGEETCGGDPVAAARALSDSGAKALVNVIGFDVDAETRGQLEAIAEAGGGKYFAAKDAAALAEHMRSAADAVNSIGRFEYCLDLNQGFAETVYNSATNSVPACYVREGERKIQDVIIDKADDFTDEADIACQKAIIKMARKEQRVRSKEMRDLYKSLNNAQREAGQAARKRSIEEALPAK